MLRLEKRYGKWLEYLLIITVFLTQLVVIVGSGVERCIDAKCGLFFWGSHAHDSVWHIALIENSFKTWPPNLPIYAGELLRGYNYLLDLIIFSVARVSALNTLDLFFRIIPAVIVGLLIVSLKKISRSRDKARGLFLWTLFLVFFSGSFSYVFTLWHEGTLWNNHGLLAMSPALNLTNLQYTASLILVVIFFHIISLKEKQTTVGVQMVLSGAIGLALLFKFYAGLILEAVFILYLVCQFFKYKKYAQTVGFLIMNCIFLGLLVMVFYQPTLGKGHSILQWAPLASVYPLIEEKSLFYLPGIANARYILEKSLFSPRLLVIQATVFVLFVILNFGTRLVGILYGFYLIFSGRAKKYHLFLMFAVAVGLVVSTFFIQDGVWWNSIQSIYYSLFLASILTAEALYIFTLKRLTIFKSFLLIVFILLTIPNALSTVNEFTSADRVVYISTAELSALSGLKAYKDGIVLIPLRKVLPLQVENSDRLSQFSHGPYVSAFSSKQMFLEDVPMVEGLRIAYTKRLDLVESFFNMRMSVKQAQSFLKNNSITYIYLAKAIYKRKHLPYPASGLGVKKIFENSEAVIYQNIGHVEVQ